MKMTFYSKGVKHTACGLDPVCGVWWATGSTVEQNLGSQAPNEHGYQLQPPSSTPPPEQNSMQPCALSSTLQHRQSSHHQAQSRGGVGVGVEPHLGSSMDLRPVSSARGGQQCGAEVVQLHGAMF